MTTTSLSDNLSFLGILIISSWGLGQIAIATKSILACACFHLSVQFMMFNLYIKDGITTNQKLYILAILILCWIIILKIWERSIQIHDYK